MSRSRWKIPSLNKNLLQFLHHENLKQTSNSIDNKNKEKTKALIVLSRNILITKKLVGKTILVHNGISLIELFIRDVMLGYKLGEFVPTFKKPVHKKKTK